MIDDVLCVNECGYKKKSSNAFITFKTDSKKLQFGSNKCKKLHIGKKKEEYKCESLKEDNWQEVEIVNDETGMQDIIDICNGEQVMEEKLEEKYLGDVISTDGRNIKNIKTRILKGKGINSRILTILDGIPYGQFYFEVAILLRNSLLVSSMLTNTEAWYNITKSEMELLETIDLQFLRSILKAPKCTPREMLFLELGCVPFRHLTMKRRILFLHYILNEERTSMLYKFLIAQIRNKKKKDWISQVLDDLKKLELSENLEQLKIMKTSTLKTLLNKLIKELAFNELTQKKENHSKVRNIMHTAFEMQNYLKSNTIKTTQEERQEIFRLRCKVTDVKSNFKGKYDNLECNICEKEEEQSQKHIIECMELNKNKSEEFEKMPRYEEIYKNNVSNQIKITRKFIVNMKRKKELEKQ